MAASTTSKSKKKELIRGPQTEVTTEVLDFIKALDDYKKSKNRPFPTWSEVLEVLKQLGYRQVEEARPIEEIGEKEAASTEDAPKPKAKNASGRGAKAGVKASAKKGAKASAKKTSKKTSKKARRKAGRKA